MIPDATIVKITMKSMRAALVSSSQHNPTHKSRMQTKRMRFPVVIGFVSYVLTCKGNHYLLTNNGISLFFSRDSFFRLFKKKDRNRHAVPALDVLYCSG